LWAYLLALLYAVARPTSAGFVRWSLVLGSAMAGAALSIAWYVGLKRRKTSILATLAVLATSGNVLLSSVSGMEWSLTLLLSLLYWMQSTPRRSPVDGRQGHLAAFAVGLLGNLGRSEFGLLAFSLWVACLAVWLATRTRKSAYATRRVTWGLLGATVGLLLVLGHTYTITGGLLQSSARMKAHWATIYGSAQAAT
jgi:hypothetical protein